MQKYSSMIGHLYSHYEESNIPTSPVPDASHDGHYPSTFKVGNEGLSDLVYFMTAVVRGVYLEWNSDMSGERGKMLLDKSFPFRAGMWSTSRRPGASVIHYHLLNGCPALVIPTTSSAPVNAWSPITLSTVCNGAYDPAAHKGMIREYLNSIISLDHLSPKMRGLYEMVLETCVSLVVDGVQRLKEEMPEGARKNLDAERAGIAFFKY
ncbi:hypothetical protein BDZ91DRAFT_712697 [Kalaharituber pfeilii]|nr:hypothetical protein BDZ91DRAFT_712697 [Kalaharituber pfeilii]